MYKQFTAILSFLCLLILAGCTSIGASSQTNRPSVYLQTIQYTDATSDLQDESGKPLDGEPFLDIEQVELTRYDTFSLARIQLRGPLPTKVDPEIFVEWDILVDCDYDSNTGWGSRLICNDIGPDYLFRLGLEGNQYKSEMLDIAAGKWDPIDHIISDNTIELRFHQSSSQPIFNLLFEVRKYRQGENVNSLLSIDKAPGKGHIQFPDGSVSDSLLDTDNDGLTDYEEALLGTSPMLPQDWDNWQKIPALLNTPQKISFYLLNQFILTNSPSQNFSVPVSRLAQDKFGGCDAYALIATYCLEKNGYVAFFVKAQFDKESAGRVNHDFCIYQDKDGYWYAIDAYYHDTGRNPLGPFLSISDCCWQIPARYGNASLAGIELYDWQGNIIY